MPQAGRSCLDEMKGAYTNALALASNADEFKKMVEHALGQLNLFAFEFEDLEPIEARAARTILNADISVLASRAATGEVCFDTFHRFMRLDG